MTTSDACVIDEKPKKGIPVFFSSDGVIQPLTDYMITLVHMNGVPPSTAETYAYKLQKFWKYLLSKGLKWTEVSDAVLIRYRDQLLSGKDFKHARKPTVRTHLNVIFQFYVWAELTKRIRGVVAIYSDKLEREYLISARTSLRTKGRVRRSHEYFWPYSNNLKGKGTARGTPTNIQMENLHAVIYEQYATTADRDSVMVELMQSGAFRSFELLQLCRSDVPSLNEIEFLRAKDEPVIVEIIGKGGAIRKIPILPETMERTWHYIYGERNSIVQRARRQNPAYTEPDNLFISFKTGFALDRQSLSHRIKELMNAAGMPDLSAHRIRARCLTNMVEAEDGVDDLGRPLPIDQVLINTQSVAGHVSQKSLAPYLTDVRKKAFRSKSGEIISKEAQLRNLDQNILRVRAVTDKALKLLQASKKLQGGHHMAALRLLKELREQIFTGFDLNEHSSIS